MKINYQTFNDNKLLVVRFEGKFSIDRYKQHVFYLKETPEWKSIEKNLVDLRSVVDFKLELEDIQTIVDIGDNLIKKNILSVQLVDKPILTVFTHLIQEGFSKYNLKSDYCYTLDRAIELLKLNKTTKELELIINNLEYNF
jgi:hypothetical protein